MVYKPYPQLTSVTSGLSNSFFPAKMDVLACGALDKRVCPVGKETVLRNFDFFLKVHEALIIIITPPPPRALMTGQLFGSIQRKESRKACPLRQKSVRLPQNSSKEATDFCLRQRHGGGIPEH